MMYLVYNNDGSIKVFIVGESIQQGNNGVNKVFVAIDGRSISNYTCIANFTLPDGEINQLTGVATQNQLVGESYFDGYTITLTEAQTQLAGKLSMSIELKDIANVTLFTYRYIFEVNPTPFIATETTITVAQYNALVQTLNSYLLKIDANKIGGNTIYLETDIVGKTINDFMTAVDEQKSAIIFTRANGEPIIVTVEYNSGVYRFTEIDTKGTYYKYVQGTLATIGNYGMYNDSHWTTVNYATQGWVQDQGYLTEHQSLDGYATESWVQNQGYITSSALSGYATQEWVTNQGYITSSALDGYATQQWVGQQGYITISALTGYATEVWVQGQNYATTSEVSTVNDKLNYNVHVEVQQQEFNFSGDTVTFTCSYVNLKTGVAGTRAETIPLANSTTAGLMSYEDYNTLISNTNRISALEGRQFRLTYTASQSPSASDIKSFVTTYLAGIGITSPTDSDYNGVSVVVSGTNHVWNYYANLSTYQDDGVDFVTIFTNSVPGIIQGTNDNTSHTNDGKVYAESNGTGSVLGWDRLTTRVYNLENGGYITVNVTNLVNYYDKDTIDLMLNDYATTTDISDMATQTWVTNQGYLTSHQTLNTLTIRKNQGSQIVDDTYNPSTAKTIVVNDNASRFNLGAFDSVDTSNSDYDLITRKTGYVDLGTLGWSYISNGRFQVSFPNAVVPSSGDTIPNLKCVAYNIVSTNDLFNNLTNLTMTLFTYESAKLLTCINTSYTVANAFKGAMQGILLQYELSSSYTEKVIKNQPLNTLDQNGSEWLREEWENTLQLWDEEWESGYYSPVDGSYQTYNQVICSKNYIKVLPNTIYYLNIRQVVNNANAFICQYDINKNFISRIEDVSSTFTTATNCAYIRFNLSTEYGSTYNHDIMLNQGDHAYPYVPYNKFKGFLKNEYKKTLNLIDINNDFNEGWHTDYIVSGNTITITGEWYISAVLNVKQNTQYYLSYNNSSGYNIVSVYDEGINNLIVQPIYNANGFDFNSGNHTRIAILFYSGQGTSATSVYSNIMLVEGDTPQPFEDYNGEIIHEKDLDIFESGENLVDKNNIKVITNYEVNFVGLNLKPNTTYFIKNFNSSYNGGYISTFWITDSNGTTTTLWSSDYTHSLVDGFAFTTPSSSGTFVAISLRNSSSYSWTTTDSNSLMLNIGSTPLPYKEYVGAIVRSGGNQIVQLKKLTIEDNTVDAVPLEIKAYDPECDIRFTDNDGGSTTDLSVRKMNNSISLPGIDGTIVVAEPGWKTLTLNSSNFYSANTTLKEYDTFMAYEIVLDGGSGYTKVIASMGIHYIPPVSPNSNVNMDLISMAYVGSNHFTLSIRYNGYASITKNNGSGTYTIMYKKIDMGF